MYTNLKALLDKRVDRKIVELILQMTEQLTQIWYEYDNCDILKERNV